MRVLCTFPGKHGDLLWALPTIRALSRRLGGPVDLIIPAQFQTLCPLLRAQPYLAKVEPMDEWVIQDTAPVSPRIMPMEGEYWQATYDHIFHLGYVGWPQRPLTFEILRILNLEQQDWLPFKDEELDLQTPWITVPPHDNFSKQSWSWCYGFTDEFFELKYGLIHLLQETPKWWRSWLPPLCVGANARWQAEAGMTPMSWLESAAVIQHASVFLGCCSALHVLAAGIGTPAVVMEPQEARWNPIFWPLGMDGPQITVVRGGDGRPTWDARHVRDALYRRIPPPAEHLSAQPCGCDPGAKWVCTRHREEQGL